MNIVGKDLKTLFSGFKAMKSEPVCFGETIFAVDKDHVCFLKGSPIVESHILGGEYFVDHTDLVVPNLDKDYFDLTVEDFYGPWIRISSENATAAMPTCEGTAYRAPVLSLNGRLSMSATHIQILMRDFGQVKPDYVILMGHDGIVEARTKGPGSSMVAWFGRSGGEDFKIAFDYRIFRKMSKLFSGDVTAEVATDYPSIWRWQGKDLSFELLIAPVVIREEK